MAKASLTVQVKFDKAKLMGKIDGKNKKAIAIITTEALKDANYYVRKDTGEMERSSLRASDFDEGKLVWDTPYAKKVYYAGNPSQDVNPHASLLWAHKGYAENSKKYEDIIAKAMQED